MGAPWLDQPVLLHSSRSDMCTLTAEQCAYRSQHFVYWYIADWVYGLGTIYFFIAVIGLCAATYWFSLLVPSRLRKTVPWRKLASAVRYVIYKPTDIRALRWLSPSLGVGILLAVGFAFFFAMTLGPHPYYWPNTKTLSFGNSPPVATRTGWMALACLPFVMVLPCQANLIAWLTGTSHEQLMIFHNWVAWAMFVLALIHTFPFIVFHIWKGDMVTQWNTSVVYWTGVVAIIAQAYLQFMSITWIRNKFYEFFKITHYIAVAVFIIFFFIHCDFRLSSWDYFIGTGVLYTLHFFYPQIRTFFEFGLKVRAQFTMVSDKTLKVTIPIHTEWYPGQHAYLRFLTLGFHAFTAHPFTICSVPRAINSSEPSEMVFYIHPREGLTGRLAAMATKTPGFKVPVLLDGPYGGLKGSSLGYIDRRIVFACGSGAGFSLGIVMYHALRLSRASKTTTVSPTLQVFIATRDNQLIRWYEEALLDFLKENKLPESLEGVQIHVHQTRGTEPLPVEQDKDLVKDCEKLSPVQTRRLSNLPILLYTGRPDIRDIIREATLEADVEVGISACGPPSLLEEASNEAAAAQLRILSGKSGAREVYLHTEVFSW